MHVDPACMTGGYIDMKKLDPIGRLNGFQYVTLGDIFHRKFEDGQQRLIDVPFFRIGAQVWQRAAPHRAPHCKPLHNRCTGSPSHLVFAGLAQITISFLQQAKTPGWSA